MYLLRSEPRWTRERILETIQRGEEQTVRLPQPIDVHLQYWTNWVADDGAVQFRKDVYGRDTLLDRAMTEAPADPIDGSTPQ